VWCGGPPGAPPAILEASRQVELYDREFDREVALDWGIHTLPALALDLRSPEAAVEGIAAAVAEWAGQGKLLCVLGGEHTVSVGVARGLSSVYGEFVTVQLDAHTGLRDTYEETPYSHACAMRRILDRQQHLVQLGIRSLDITEAEYVRDNPDRVTTFFADDRSYLEQLGAAVRGKKVWTSSIPQSCPPRAPPNRAACSGTMCWRSSAQSSPTAR
jgi:agmatinase